jgi:hypothetical protein
MRPLILKTWLLFNLNHAIDTGEYEITIKEMRDAVNNAAVPTLLKERLGRDVDLSIVTVRDWAELHKEWQALVAAVDHDRKFGVSRNGLCLLVAYLLESIQSAESSSHSPGDAPATPTYH